jgi:hypothetical protein
MLVRGSLEQMETRPCRQLPSRPSRQGAWSTALNLNAIMMSSGSLRLAWARAELGELRNLNVNGMPPPVASDEAMPGPGGGGAVTRNPSHLDSLAVES